MNVFKKLTLLLPYHRLQHIKYITKGGFGSVYSAYWLDGRINFWNVNDKEWNRSGYQKVALKSLNNSSDSTLEFLKEVELCTKIAENPFFIQCLGISRD